MKLDKLKEQRETLNFMLDVSVLAELEMQMIEIVDEFDVFNVIKKDLNIKTSIDYLNRPRAILELYGNDLYDNITLNKNSAVGSMTIDCCIDKEILIKGRKCKLSFTATCALPDEDLITLRMLGKVHEEIIPARIETSVYCKT